MFQLASMCTALAQHLHQKQQQQPQQRRSTLQQQQQPIMPDYQNQQQRSLSRFFSKKAKQKGRPAAGKPKSKPQPVMRHMHRQMALRNVAVAVCCSAVAAVTFYVFHNKRRRNIVRQFYGTYDAEASFERMRDCGYLQSCPAENSD